MGLYLFSWLCILIFVLAASWRVARQLRMPLHVRWELYPVMHEAGRRAEYGGSYMEESDWWEKPRRSSLWNEIRYMVPEILLMRGLWKENPRLWLVSFPFHFGLYLLLGAAGLLFLGALTLLAGHPVSPQGGLWSGLLFYATLACTLGGLFLGIAGSVGLFHRRLTDPPLRAYAAPRDYINLILFLLFFVCALLAWGIQDPSLDGARAFALGLITLGGAVPAVTPADRFLGSVTVVLASVIAAYIPLTHMSHMFMKYFLYHNVRWDDAPAGQGGRMNAEVRKNLALRPDWQAAHVGANGRRSWGDIAQGPKENP